MNALIVGYGRMGHEVENFLLERGHKIVGRVDKESAEGKTVVLTEDLLKASDVVIEFALPEAVIDHVALYAKVGIPSVIGTTGWDERRHEAQELILKHGGAMVYGSNFSLGAHMFFHLVEKAAGMIAEIPDYDIMVTEYHHKMKKDSPSGTALSVAERILRACPRKRIINSDRINRAIRDEELHVASVRGGTIPGIHSVLLDSMADSIEIRHTARSRSGFALGAVIAAEWILGKKGFYEVQDFARDFLSNQFKK